MTIKVVAVDDHPSTLWFIENQINQQSDMELVGTCTTHGKDLLDLVRTTKPDVMILDLQITGEAFKPVTTVQNLKREAPDVNFIVFTGVHSEVLMRRLTDAGVRGYLLKTDNLSLDIPEAVRKVHMGRRHLSPAVSDTLLDSMVLRGNLQKYSEQELNIIHLLCQGLRNKQIAAELHVTPKSVGNALTKIYDKLNLTREGNTRTQAIEKARELGLC